MRKLLSLIISSAVFTAAFTSCDDDDTSVGSSLITDQSEIVIDSTFVVSGHSVLNSSVQSRTSTQLIGRIDAKGYGRLSSDIVTQFMPAMTLDTTGVGVDDITKMEMLMFFSAGSFTGDSLVPMGIQIYPLTKALPSPIYSDFDPADYYNPADMWESKIYTGNALSNDSLNNLSYRTIAVELPLSFAKSFYSEYIKNPQTFASPEYFTTKFFKGLYIKNSFGDGRITNINETRINLSYNKHDTYTRNDTVRDTVYHRTNSYMAVTPEVISNNIIKFDISEQLKSRVAAGEALLVAPAGYDVEMQFPLVDIINAYRRQSGQLSVINTLTMSIPYEAIDNDYNIMAPSNVLVVLKKDKNDFFANNKLADNATSFLATYNSTTKSYDISNMRQYLLDNLAKEQITADDYTFIITPVYVTTETQSSSYYQSGSTYVTGVSPYVDGPAMVKLLLDKTKIKLTFGKQSANF